MADPRDTAIEAARAYFDLMESPAVRASLLFAAERGVGIVPGAEAAKADAIRAALRDALAAVDAAPTSDPRAEFLAERGVETPCETCGGLGTRVYGNTSTWGSGAGGQMLTRDVCNRCWGTGDAHRHGVNLRKLEAEWRRVGAPAVEWKCWGDGLYEARVAGGCVLDVIEMPPDFVWKAWTPERVGRAPTLDAAKLAAERAAGVRS